MENLKELENLLVRNSTAYIWGWVTMALSILFWPGGHALLFTLPYFVVPFMIILATLTIAGIVLLDVLHPQSHKAKGFLGTIIIGYGVTAGWAVVRFLNS
jgi:hypothetical protein